MSKVTIKNDTYGKETVIKNGIPYPNSYWAKLEVVPVKNPDYKPGSKASEWIHPDRLAARQKTEGSVKGSLNNVSDKAKTIKDYSDGYALAYDIKNSAYNPLTGKMVRTGNALGRLGYRIFGALAGKLAADRNQRTDKWKKKLLDGIDFSYRNSDKRNNPFGNSATGSRSFIGTRQVKDTTQKSNILKNLASTLGKVTTAKGRASLGASMIGTAEGIASGIVNSDIGKAAIKAGREVYNSVKSGLKDTLDVIVAIFSPEKRKHMREEARSYHPQAITAV